MTLRMTMAMLAAVNCMVALYLHLWKIGLMGALTCGANHGCEIAQFSSYGYFLGVDVALIGTVGYAAVFLVSLAGTREALANAPWPTRALQLMIWPAVLFTLRLKYGEFVVLKTFCPWCAISAVSITILAVLVTLDARRVSRLAAAPPPPPATS
ncbi:MAG: vitamin K epoxide reductase family protein [Gemmatimonadetes bacterium]|nr:vitamin K epoxide reductase family protein [Gemmatimonadota bacterium]